ncbi:hypothetical protein [Microbispora sp. NBC_01389]|uniref:hypothetical protein n=1 Tax=Microbispora sp. NBC_01389 TaxID=2903584 RepID=UPI00324A2DD6
MQLLLALRMDLANARFVARDYAAALSDFDEVLPTLAEVLGARHPAVLDCRYNQALSNAALSQNEVALRQMTSLLADVQAARGESDLLALLLRREIAALLIKLGERRQAGVFLRGLLPEMDAILGRDHPETQQARILLENLDQLGSG